MVRRPSLAFIIGVMLIALLLGVVLVEILVHHGESGPTSRPSAAAASSAPAPTAASPAPQVSPSAVVPPAAVAPLAAVAPAPARLSVAAATEAGSAAGAGAPPRASAPPAPPAAEPVAASPTVPVASPAPASPAPVPSVPPATAPTPPATPEQGRPRLPVPEPPEASPAAAPLPAAPARPCVASRDERMNTVVVLPVDNLSGGSMPSDEIRQDFVRAVRAAGPRVVESTALDAFMTRHRIRYEAGVDDAVGRALRQELGADGVLVVSFEFMSAANPPKIALSARLVSLKGAPTVVWADGTGLAGDDAPGLFGLRLVTSYAALQQKAMDRIGSSLAAYLKGGAVDAGPAGSNRLKPRVLYRSIALQEDRKYTVAVVPFLNLSGRRTAGDTLQLLFVRYLSRLPQFCVVDPGVVREQLLDARVIMNDGLSLSDAEKVAAPVDADFVLSGLVVRYADYEGSSGQASVEFSTLLIDKRSRKVVWRSESDNEGRDTVGLFERGITKTAHAMATQMVRLTTDLIAGRGR